MIDIIPKIDPDLIFPVLNYEPIYNFIIKNGTDQKINFNYQKDKK